MPRAGETCECPGKYRCRRGHLIGKHSFEAGESFTPCGCGEEEWQGLARIWCVPSIKGEQRYHLRLPVTLSDGTETYICDVCGSLS